MVTSTHKQSPNRLIQESSPYLLQHAYNPVDWHPWGREAFARAQAENKPVFLSIGYAACHWCHVMERESFENEEIARLLNEHFICIKVDREERPDLDDLYMQAVQLIQGSGGWPLSVFLTPDGKPFYGGTYFPPEDRLGRIGLKRLLLSIDQSWRDQQAKARGNGQAMLDAIKQNTTPLAGAHPLDVSLLAQATHLLKKHYDPEHGGFGEAPKFPPAMALELLLREHKRTGDAELLEMVERTLRKMALGGLHDQLGGGFHRYCVDPNWLVPHFEKMLYDNALLAPLYLNAGLVTGDDFYTTVGRRILDYVLREMTDAQGGFYSSQDADSEGVEGKFYVWRPEEAHEALGEEDAALFCEYFDVMPQGNWPDGGGASILNARQTIEDFAMVRGRDPQELRARLEAARLKMLQRRAGRAAPLKDDKILTSWNGLMIAALAKGAQITGEERYVTAAAQAAQFLLDHLRAADGGLLRSWRLDRAQINGFLDDYANLINGLIDLYETTFDPSFAREAESLGRVMMERFEDRREGGFFATDGRDATVLARIKEFYDGVMPSGNASAVHALQRLGRLFGREEALTAARRTMELISEQMARLPDVHHWMLCAVAFELSPPQEVAIIGKPDAPGTQTLLRAYRSKYRPHGLLAMTTTDGSEGALIEVPMLENKPPLGGRPTAYVCQNMTCQTPVQTPEELNRLLR